MRRRVLNPTLGTTPKGELELNPVLCPPPGQVVAPAPLWHALFSVSDLAESLNLVALLFVTAARYTAVRVLGRCLTMVPWLFTKVAPLRFKLSLSCFMAFYLACW